MVHLGGLNNHSWNSLFFHVLIDAVRFKSIHIGCLLLIKGLNLSAVIELHVLDL